MPILVSSKKIVRTSNYHCLVWHVNTRWNTSRVSPLMPPEKRWGVLATAAKRCRHASAIWHLRDFFFSPGFGGRTHFTQWRCLTCGCITFQIPRSFFFPLSSRVLLACCACREHSRECWRETLPFALACIMATSSSCRWDSGRSSFTFKGSWMAPGVCWIFLPQSYKTSPTRGGVISSRRVVWHLHPFVLEMSRARNELQRTPVFMDLYHEMEANFRKLPGICLFFFFF